MKVKSPFPQRTLQLVEGGDGPTRGTAGAGGGGGGRFFLWRPGRCQAEIEKRGNSHRQVKGSPAGYEGHPPEETYKGITPFAKLS